MGLIWIIAAAGWGVAEATLFFLAPDVILTVIRISTKSLGVAFARVPRNELTRS